MEKKRDVVWCRLKDRGVVPWPKELKDITHLQIYDPTDADLLHEVKQWVGTKCELQVMDSPQFIFSLEQLQEYRKSKLNQTKKIYHHASFYSWARKQTGTLMNPNGTTVGGKLSFDTSNRQPIPRKDADSIPSPYCWRSTPRLLTAIKNAWEWTSITFPDHYGPEPNIKIKSLVAILKQYAFTVQHAHKLLDFFIQKKLESFGTFQDAIPLPSKSTFVYHSNISHCLNNGLLKPQDVIRKVEQWYHTHPTPHNLSQCEGFIRQVIGWREYCRMAAVFDRDMLWKANGLHANKQLTSAWYRGQTGVAPVDAIIHKAFDTGYLHHIERLMIMGNFMTLSQIHPRQMYNWFMEFSMDSYDWVMILNVFGMAAHADLGTTFTKPYVSSSNYVLKMSHFPKDKSWTEVWDTLFYSFLNRHKTKFNNNPRMNLMMRLLKNKQ